MLRKHALGPSLGPRLLLSLILAVWFAGAKAAAQTRPSCEAHPGLTVVDISTPVTELRVKKAQALDVLAQFGVKTIIRYYDHDPETIACKTLLPDESDEILAKGFSIAVVFQHNNGDPETFFSETRGEEDANRALALAAANGQPFGSAIYFGVDGADQVIKDVVDEFTRFSGGKPMTEERKTQLKKERKSKHIRFYARFLQYKNTYFKGRSVETLRASDILPFVENYFVEINRVFQEAAAANPDRQGYYVGGYGSGLVCDFLLTKKLVNFCWLAQSRGWPDYEAFRNSDRWSLLQEKETVCPSWVYVREKKTVKLDFNASNASAPDFGQWSRKLAETKPIPRPKHCPPLPTH